MSFSLYRKNLWFKVICISILFLLSFTCSSIAAKKSVNVLILSSYHIGFGGTDPMVEGIKTAFSKHDMNIEFYFEYLDSKRFSPDLLFDAIEKLFHKKYTQTKFDVIIVADNNAFNFILKVRDRLFPNIPVVFCGINNYKDSMIENIPLITGVAEEISIKETIYLALSLHPDTTHLGVICDSTITGIANLQKFKTIIPTLPKNINIIDLANLSAEYLAKKLRTLPEKTVLLQLSFYMDANGKRFTPKEQMDLILENCDKPIYSAWDFFITHGVLGGIVTYFPLQGETAGNMAIQILKGKPVDQIPVVKTSPNVSLFDYNTLIRYNISLSELPSGSIILNRPQTLYYKYKSMVWGGSIFLILQTVMIGALIIAIKRIKQAEGALQEREAFLDTLINAIPIPVFYKDKDGRYLEFNKAFESFLGKTKEDLIGKSAFDINPKYLAEIYQAKDNELFKSDGKQQYESQVKNANGQLRDVILNKSILNDKMGSTIGLIGAILDITERKCAELALKESEKKYQTILNSMKEPLYIGSQDLIIHYMNPAMLKRTGHDATGERCFKAIHDLDERCPWCHCEDVMVGNVHEIDIVSPKDKHSFHVSITPIVNNDGSISSLNVLRDVTEFKKMETSFQQSQKMEAIGTLAGGIAHDFNNILFPIVGHTEMLMEDFSEDSPVKDSLKEIYTAALRAKNLVQQILAFSRQENSELKLMKMQSIINEALKLIRSTIPTTITINQSLQPDCGAVKADPTQIHQIVMNLTTNAYHAMENDGGELKVVLKEVELGQQDLIHTDLTPGRYACLTVSDTGIGITKDVIDKIFEPFFTTKEKGKGTGMGLSVVHGIIKNMSGKIEVDSELGKGTEFHIYLPIAESAFKIEESSIKEPIQGGTESILLIDDEEVIIKMEKQALERLGYHVTLRISSIEALELFRTNPDKFDLVITDMAMPKMPGDKLAVELIRIRPDIPILLCTGFSEPMTEEKIKSLGIKDLLLKPIIIKDLARKIREVLDEAHRSE